MKLHDRVDICDSAKSKLQELLLEFDRSVTCELTYAEAVRLYNDALSDRISTIIKYAIRNERHGCADTPGDGASV